MRRRLDLAASLIAQPPLIFLAQPTTGLDPRTRGQMRDTIRALVATGSAVVLATPYLDEADRLADRITVIDRSRVVAEGTADAGHELRTPLTLLSTRAQLLRRELADGPAGRIDAPRARDGLDETVADVRALTGVLEDLLIAADSRRDAERAPVDLTAEAGAVVAALRTEAAARGIAMVPGAHARPRHRHVVQMPERSDGNPARAQYSGTRRLLRMKKAPPTTRRLPRAARRI